MSDKPTAGRPGESCPIPLSRYPHVLLGHGGGGRLMHDLIEKLFIPQFGGLLLDQRHDGAILEAGNARLAFTTDSYVVRPLFFPGGDIGKLAVNGTINDLAMCGARPLCLSAGLILEEGLPMEILQQVIESMSRAASASGVHIVTGDTKVVDRGKGDGIFINTSGIGIVDHDAVILPSQVQAGDALLINGDLGRHGIAIMNAREGLELRGPIESDSAPLANLVKHLLDEGIEVHCLRDLTRGGLASALIEIAEAVKLGVQIDENAIPVLEEVRGACELLGLDPLYVANEGRMLAFVASHQADRALRLMQSDPAGAKAALIGKVVEDAPGLVRSRSWTGVERVIDMLSGDQLPRIC